MQTQTKAQKRKELLIEPYKQLHFGVSFLILNFIFSILIISVFSYYLYDIYTAQAELFNLNEDQSSQILSKLLIPVSYVIVLELMFVLITLFLSVRYTHQFYGPLVTIKRFVEDLNEGKNPKPIQLRATDQLQELATSLNNLNKNLSERKHHDA